MMEWTEAQTSLICRGYSNRQSLVCPECGAAVSAETVEGPKPKTQVVTFLCSGCGRMTRKPFVSIGPEDFIRKPYAACPACGTDRFGLLFVHGDGYGKRCASCLHEESYQLPRLQKTLIYLDQMAISNMMFALNPETEQFKAGRIDQFWPTLFTKLDRLTKLHLVVCPDTVVQEQESLAHKHFEALRRTYEQLSHGVTFEDDRTIERFQLIVHAMNWLNGQPEKAPHLDRHQVMHGDPHGWTETMRISVRSRVTAEHINAIRDARDRVYDGVHRIFEQWQGQAGQPFELWFEREVLAAGQTILSINDDRIRRLAEIQAGLRVPTMEDFDHPSAVVTFFMIHDDFEQTGLSWEEAWTRTRQYFSSPYLRHVPSIKISAMIWAAIARKAAAGQKRPPSRGTFNDVKVIASLLPYCDAMFVDNEMRGYLAEEPLATELRFGARIFSTNNREDLLAYLDGLERSATPEHLALVRKVYGDGWGEPFVEMFRRDSTQVEGQKP